MNATRRSAALILLLASTACASGGGAPPVEDPAPDAEGFITTSSGLRYRILRQGAGPSPTSRDLVVVHYSTKLDDGTVIDSSYERGQPEVLAVRDLIRGFREALELMSVGGHVEAIVPSRLGYGWRGTGDGLVGPNATLHFEIELYRVQER